MKNTTKEKTKKLKPIAPKKKDKKTATKQNTSLQINWVVYVVNFFMFLLLLNCSQPTQAQTIGASVINSGAATLVQPRYIHRSTVGQALIRRIANPQADSHRLGFWYNAYVSIRRAGGAVVSMPIMEANLGDTISVPLLLVSSANIVSGGKQNFTARVRYNNTLLKPIDTSLPLRFEGNDAIVTFSGTIEQASGILATLRFKVLMGNASRTPLDIDSFSIGINTKYNIVKKNGELAVKDLCEAGDTTRLFNRVLPASLALIRPNPVETTAEIDLTLSESGFTSLTLIDLSGRKVATIWEADAVKGFYTKIFVVGTLSNGEYFLQLKTPNELFAKKLLISR